MKMRRKTRQRKLKARIARKRSEKRPAKAAPAAKTRKKAAPKE